MYGPAETGLLKNEAPFAIPDAGYTACHGAAQRLAARRLRRRERDHDLVGGSIDGLPSGEVSRVGIRLVLPLSVERGLDVLRGQRCSIGELEVRTQRERVLLPSLEIAVCCASPGTTPVEVELKFMSVPPTRCTIMIGRMSVVRVRSSVVDSFGPAQHAQPAEVRRYGWPAQHLPRALPRLRAQRA